MFQLCQSLLCLLLVSYHNIIFCQFHTLRGNGCFGIIDDLLIDKRHSHRIFQSVLMYAKYNKSHFRLNHHNICPPFYLSLLLLNFDLPVRFLIPPDLFPFLPPCFRAFFRPVSPVQSAFCCLFWMNRSNPTASKSTSPFTTLCQ